MSQAKVTQAPWEQYANAVAEFYGPEAQARRFREEAERYDLLAGAASLDGDSEDAAACRAKATEARRKARRCEANARAA